MRTIKFRGKILELNIGCDKNIGDWVYGDLHLLSKIPHIHTTNSRKYIIDTETVGQYTGLKDKNGVEIYEGSVMLIHATEFNVEIIGVVEFNSGSYVVRSFFSDAHISLACAVREHQSGERIGIVIGNIYDNPELLKIKLNNDSWKKYLDISVECFKKHQELMDELVSVKPMLLNKNEEE